jgi:hypothetical protein
MKENEIGGACRTHGKGAERVKGFVVRKSEWKKYLEALDGL